MLTILASQEIMDLSLLNLEEFAMFAVSSEISGRSIFHRDFSLKTSNANDKSRHHGRQSGYRINTPNTVGL